MLSRNQTYFYFIVSPKYKSHLYESLNALIDRPFDKRTFMCLIHHVWCELLFVITITITKEKKKILSRIYVVFDGIISLGVFQNKTRLANVRRKRFDARQNI